MMTRALKYQVLFLVTFVSLNSSLAQNIDSINVNFEALPLEIIFDSIAEKTNYQFSYNSEILPPGSLYSYKNSKVFIGDLLNVLFIGTGLEYVKIQDQYVIKRSIKSVQAAGEMPGKVSIIGWVREANSKSPIAGANVYIQGSTIGTTTDLNGNYRITNIEPGNYVLVFSHIGYKTASHILSASEGQSFSVNALMGFRVEELQDVEVISAPFVRDPIERSRHFETFKKELLGSSVNAQQCQIQNQEILDYTFNGDNGFLQVFASEPVVVINKGLGYQIIMDLNFFNIKGNVINFHGQARYEPIEPKSAKQRKRWKRNRRNAYNGSMIHFLYALVNDKLEQEGYRIGLAKSLSFNESVETVKVTRDSLIRPLSGKNEWLLSFGDYLYVEYLKEYDDDLLYESDDESLSSLAESQQKRPQQSLIKLKEGSIIVDKNGKIDDRLSVISYGYWSWERLADLMPINYNPKKDIFENE